VLGAAEGLREDPEIAMTLDLPETPLGFQVRERGKMVLRWVGAALLQVTGGFRRVRGMRDLPKLCAALDRHRSAPTLNTEREVA
jgi:hypothetical protein